MLQNNQQILSKDRLEKEFKKKLKEEIKKKKKAIQQVKIKQKIIKELKKESNKLLKINNKMHYQIPGESIKTIIDMLNHEIREIENKIK